MKYPSLRSIPLNRAVSSLATSFILLAGVGCNTTPPSSPELTGVGESPYPDPARFEQDIAAFEAADAPSMPPTDAILFIGSSSITMWNAQLPEDMAPLTVIPRGFGGSTMQDLIHYADRVVFPYQPKAIVVYEGDNDVAFGISPERFFERLQVFVQMVDERLPDTEIYFLSIKPSGSRWSLWPEMERANDLIRNYTQGRDDLHYIDVASPLLNEAGEPESSYFIEDNLHLSPEGYAVWTEVVKGRLLETYAE